MARIAYFRKSRRFLLLFVLVVSPALLVDAFQIQNKKAGVAVLCDKNWDKIIASESDGCSDDYSITVDMRYNARNCMRAGRTYAAIKEAGGPAADLYGCITTTHSDAVFWFLGKVAHVSDVSLAQCVSRQWSMIQQHAANLRPLELYPSASQQLLELWCAPVDSELDVAYNRPEIKFSKMQRNATGAEAIQTTMIGFVGEVYEGGEEGFRTWRFVADGSPSRAEITSSPVQETDRAAESKPQLPTGDEKLDKLQKSLEVVDIETLYEEQERRKREGSE